MPCSTAPVATQDVKNAASRCAAVMLAQTADLQDASRVAAALEMLVDRLHSETTRLTAVRAIEAAAKGPAPVDMSGVLGKAAPEIAGFLRLADRSTRLAALKALGTLAMRQGVRELRVVWARSDLPMVSSSVAAASLPIRHCFLKTLPLSAHSFSKTLPLGTVCYPALRLPSRVPSCSHPRGQHVSLLLQTYFARPARRCPRSP